MNEIDEIEALILISETKYCPFRIQGNRYFGWNEPTTCPYRKRFERDFYLYIADKKRKKDIQEYPDEK